MKLNWEHPNLLNLSLKNTEKMQLFDTGHGYDDYNHTHICTCGAEFTSWQNAQNHEKAMTISGQGASHKIGCKLIS